MKIYFACSISGGRDHAHVYQDIIEHIKAGGATVVSEMFADKLIKAEHGPTPDLKPFETWQRDVNFVRSVDAVIAEVTQPSLGVGYEIAVAERLKKPVLALFYSGSGRRLSPMIAGNPHVTVFEYGEVAETKKVIKDFVKRLTN